MAKSITAKTAKATTNHLNVDVFSVTGEKAGTVVLPESVFGQSVNKSLLKQAIQIYLVNQRQGTLDTKTRGEINMTKAKWYRQKGTGRARHGAKSAPIFVKGGVAHGPHPREFEQSLSKVMRKKALQSAFSSIIENLKVVEGMGGIDPKTKSYVTLLSKLSDSRGRTLVLTPADAKGVYRGVRNMENVLCFSVMDVTSYDIVNAKKIILMKEALESLEKRIAGGNS